jgi:ornithine cyclodeaminase
MAKTLAAFSAGQGVRVLRSAVPLGEQKLLGLMPGAQGAVAGAKVITVFPGNFKKGLPSHQGVIVLFDLETGALKALVDGEAITALRTAAVSAVATDALARPDARVLAILGAGEQARRHLEAMPLVRDITALRVWDIHPEAARRFAEEAGRPVTLCATAGEAAQGADILCTVTAAATPVLRGADLSPGVHVNAVGACAPSCRELDTQAVLRGRLFCDSRESLLAESGDFLIPLQEGALDAGHVQGEIGQVLAGILPGRRHSRDITLFKSLGLAAEDIAAAEYVASRLAEQEQEAAS